MAIRTYYPREQILPNNEAMALWYRELQDIPYPVAEAVLRKWVSTNKWSPSIAEIRAEAAVIQNGETPDWGEAWEKVIGAIKRYGSYNVGKAMDSFDPLTRNCVERLGFRDLCLSENIMADRANFRMIYEQLAEREKTKVQIALPVQQAIKKLQFQSKDGFLQIGAGDGQK
jgi:hypothetical protein